MRIRHIFVFAIPGIVLGLSSMPFSPNLAAQGKEKKAISSRVVQVRHDDFEADWSEGFHETPSSGTHRIPPFTMREQYLSGELQIDPSLANKPISRESGDSHRYSPQIEYLADGFDEGPKAQVLKNRRMNGLGPEDTVVAYDTPDGRQNVQHSNRVHIYSPRFGSVRKIEGLSVNEQNLLATAANGTTNYLTGRGARSAGQTAQEENALYARGKTELEGTRSNSFSTQFTSRKASDQFKIAELPVSLSNILQQKKLETNLRPILAQGKENAIAWSGTQGLLVRINELTLNEMTGVDTTQYVYALREGEASREIRLTKVASKDSAQPGDTVEFTLRFENTGNISAENITILDSLTARLEFLPGTAKSSVPAKFFVEPNEVGSFILRWEITEPMKVGDFGVVVFQCRVR